MVHALEGVEASVKGGSDVVREPHGLGKDRHAAAGGEFIRNPQGMLGAALDIDGYGTLTPALQALRTVSWERDRHDANVNSRRGAVVGLAVAGIERQEGRARESIPNLICVGGAYRVAHAAL